MREMKQTNVGWIGQIPKAWMRGRIKNIICEYGSGTTPESGNELHYNDGSHYWIQSGDLYGTTYITNTQKKLTDYALLTFKSLRKYTKDFLIIAMYGASIGNAAISKIDAYVNQACYCLKADKNNDLKFLFYSFCACKDSLL